MRTTMTTADWPVSGLCVSTAGIHAARTVSTSTATPSRRQSMLSSSFLAILLALVVILNMAASTVAVEDFVMTKKSVKGQDNAARSFNRFAEQPNNNDVGQGLNQAPVQNVANSINNNINNNNNININNSSVNKLQNSVNNQENRVNSLQNGVNNQANSVNNQQNSVNNQQNSVNNQLNSVNDQGNSVNKQANNQQALDPAIQILEKHKEQAAEEARRTEEIKKQIEEHERKMAARQQQIDERERQRRERERLLNEQRQQAERLQQSQRDRDVQDRQRNDQKEREREQAWVMDVQKKSQEKLFQRQQQQTAAPLLVQPEDTARQAPFVGHDQPAPGPNAADIHAAFQPQVDINREPERAGQEVPGAGGVAVNRSIGIIEKPQADPTASPRNQNDPGNGGIVVPDIKQRASNNEVSNDQFIKPAEPAVAQEKVDPNLAVNSNNNRNDILGIPLNPVNNAINNEVNRNDNPNMGLNNGINSNNNINNGAANVQTQPQPAQQPQQPQIGGINLSWDWEDFSIMFNNYGAAEMKVRRSPHPTTGEPWPMPQYYSKKDNKVYKISKDLRFIPTGVMCDILEEGLARHLQRVLRGSVEDMYDNLQNAEGTFVDDPTLRYEKEEFLKAPFINRVEIKVRKPCEKYPALESDESYDLVVKKKKTYIWANEVWGALRGLETFGHLVWKGTDNYLYIKETVISDYPRFPHRGIHMDTSRHFLFKEVILDILESMEMNKLNVLHWHIVDDQSFPYESKVYPELSRKGAFHPTYVYTLDDIAEIIEYARLRGIRVMPEFDTPGHTYAWGLSRPELLTQCYSGNNPVRGYLGPIDPSKNATYRFLQSLFQEVMDVFKDQYLHLGGDEVPLGCWQSNPEVTAFAQELARKAKTGPQQVSQYNNNNNFGGWSMWSDEIRKVYEYYENRLIGILNDIGQKRKKGVKYIMWQEVINNNLQLPNDTIIQVWMGDMGDVMRATSMGYQVLYSTCWYLDHVEYGTKWPKYYNCDPVDQSYGYHIDEKKVLGGEAAFWAEYFSNENLIPLMWPRASAAAERLWSHKDVKNVDKAAERLAEHRCRMIKRGINAGEISGPGYCLHSPAKRRLFNDTVGCKGGNCSRPHSFVQIEDIELHVSQRGGSLAECGNVFTRGSGNIFIMLTLALVVVAALYALTRTSSRFHRIRICKNRSILIVFVVVLLVYFLCYTTIWMRAFEFSGSFHKTLQEDNRSGSNGVEEDSANEVPVNS